jgi:hypothetical protein
MQKPQVGLSRTLVPEPVRRRRFRDGFRDEDSVGEVGYDNSVPSGTPRASSPVHDHHTHQAQGIVVEAGSTHGDRPKLHRRAIIEPGCTDPVVVSWGE